MIAVDIISSHLFVDMSYICFLSLSGLVVFLLSQELHRHRLQIAITRTHVACDSRCSQVTWAQQLPTSGACIITNMHADAAMGMEMTTVWGLRGCNFLSICYMAFSVTTVACTSSIE